MKAVNDTLLAAILDSPHCAAVFAQELSYAYPEAHESMLSFRLMGHLWKITFGTQRKCPGLKIATLVHPELDVVVRQQNPLTETDMGQAARAGHEVYQVYVKGDPRRYILDGRYWNPVGTPWDLRVSS